MENLTIKELAALAANGTKVYVFDKPEFLQRYLEFAPNGNWAVELTLENCKEYVLKSGYKLILFPLSSLTKEITINGEIVKVIDYISLTKKDSQLTMKRVENNQSLDSLAYWKIERLLELKFDIFNLIERGLAIEVTETFNPYK